MRPEEQPQRMYAINVGLAALYAGVIALLVYLILPRVTRPATPPR